MSTMEETLRMGTEVEVPVGIDHGQFIACDRSAELDIDSYGDLAQRQGLAMWRGNRGVTIFTASNWTETHATVRLSPGRPAVAVDEWDHVVEGGLIINSGRLHIYGPEDTGAEETEISLPSDSYSLIVCGHNLDSTNEYGDNGSDTYTLLLWPGPALDRRVLKDGFSGIAG
jgi:hypothetical protein